MRVILVGLLAIGLSVLPAQADTIIGPSGKPLDQVKCKMDPQDCYRQAGKLCKGSYQVIDSESHSGGLLADIIPGPVTWYSMVFQCGPS